MTKLLMLVYSLVAYLLGLASIVYIIGFLTDFSVPKSINNGEAVSTSAAVAIDACLVGLFGLHHSVTARRSFKRWWMKFVPPPIERATYLYMTAIMTGLLVVFWRPIPITIWNVEGSIAVSMIVAASSSIWIVMVAATFHFGHFNFLGLTQAWRNFRQTAPKESDMSARYLYALVRHPISLGWMIAPFLVPHFTVGHLVFAASTFVYIMLATPFEEADLIEEIGEPYRDYRKHVQRFLPFTKRKKVSAQNV